ncbi:isoprenylcysteine carboxylmethyltransferase family protein [Parvibaculum sp.]|uniref:methyltransferase family protein n=1 Tax=Parvibaculum sp. TaxID=2024848 RepID=UPI000C5535FA|nr:isoprenylcysteine carboxylmethyltransferase family protein [Parvibaculum sp.]MAM93276.1 isoprenylcysteine carboxyl methyltransferase [Parvibaculum sp.]|tara:strand:+ start:3654 stop:4304 length:651 start_codon:yes stop_codon:yes gene_type:complete
MHDGNAYGLWSLVILNSAIFIIFAFSFAKPRSRRDWRSLGAFSAFIVALFTEMYGFPLTIYLLSGWLQSQFPETDIFSHDAGHLWHTLLGWDINPHFDPLHILSNLLIFGGFIMLASAWRVLHAAQQQRELATEGIYARMRHPQYSAFIVIMFGFLLQWPTLPTLTMFPVLVYVYVRLARREEQEALREFGDRYRAYMARTPAFIPSRNSNATAEG